MLDLSFRDVVLAAAIVIALTVFFVERHVLMAVLEPIRAFW